MLRSPCKGRNLIIETLTFQIYCSNNFSFLLKWSTIKNQHGKIRIYFLEECNKLHKYQTRFSVKTFIFIISTWGVYHAIHYVLQLPKYFNPNWHKCSFWAPGPKVKTFFEILWFYWIHLMILEKMRSCLWIFELGFWAYGWIRLLGPSGPNLVSRPQAPWSRHFLRFYHFNGFISWFLRKWGPVCEYYWS